jgi:hypothetical protein
MKPTSGQQAPRRWSQHVTETSNALDLEHLVFKQRSPRGVARSLKRSAEQSTRRKASPYQSAMSMLTFYLNRAGRNLPAQEKEILTRAKEELRRLYHRPPAQRPARPRAMRRP